MPPAKLWKYNTVDRHLGAQDRAPMRWDVCCQAESEDQTSSGGLCASGALALSVQIPSAEAPTRWEVSCQTESLCLNLCFSLFGKTVSVKVSVSVPGAQSMLESLCLSLFGSTRQPPVHQVQVFCEAERGRQIVPHQSRAHLTRRVPDAFEGGGGEEKGRRR